jgi:hypothetical protein
VVYLLVRPFITDPDGARTLPGDPRSAVSEEGKPALSEAVLTLNDLPTGWSSLADPGRPPLGFCGGRNPLAAVIPLEELHATFGRSAGGPFVSDTALRFGSTDEAKDLMALVAGTLATCRSYDDSGTSVVLEPLDFVGLGDDTFAVHVTGQSGAGPVEGNIVWVRKENRVVSVGTIAFSDLDRDLVAGTDLIELLTETVVKRL